METVSTLLAWWEPQVHPYKGKWRGALMFSLTEQTVEQTYETPVIWDAIVFIVTSL